MAISEKKLDSFLSTLKRKKEKEKERELMLADDKKAIRKSGSFNYGDNILGGSETSPLQRERIRRMEKNAWKRLPEIARQKAINAENERIRLMKEGYRQYGDSRNQSRAVRDQDIRQDFLRKAFAHKDKGNPFRKPQENPLEKDEGMVQGFLNKYGPASLRSPAENERRFNARKRIQDERVRVAAENKAAIERGVDPKLAQEAERIEGINNLSTPRPNVYDTMRADSETFDDLAMDEASEEQFIKDEKNAEILKQIDQEYDKRGIGEVQGYSPEQKAKYKRRGQEGVPISELISNQQGRQANQAERRKWEMEKLGIGDPDDPAETGHMINEILPELHKKQYGKTKEDTEMSELDRIAEEENRMRELATARPTMLEEGDERGMKTPEGIWKKDYETLDDEAQDQADPLPQGADAEEEVAFDPQGYMNLSKPEQEEVIDEVAKQKGKGSEEYIAAKEATGRYVRYEGSGLLINKDALDKAFKRKEHMLLLQHVPKANRPAMLVEWGYVDKKDLSTMQKQSAKELKELSLLDLRIAKTKSEIENNKNKLSSSDQILLRSATNGFNQAIKDNNYELAQTYREEIGNIIPISDNSNFAKLFEKGIAKNKIKTTNKVFTAYGLKNGEQYYNTSKDLIKKINFIKTGTTNKGTELEKMLNIEVPDPKNPNKSLGTYGDLLKNQGLYQWDVVKNVDPAEHNLPEWAVKSEENYMKYSLDVIHDKLMNQIYGNLHDEVKRLNFRNLEQKKEEHSKILTIPGVGEVVSGELGYRDPANLTTASYADQKIIKKGEIVAKQKKKEKEKKIAQDKANKIKRDKNEEQRKHDKEIENFNLTKVKGKGTEQKSKEEKSKYLLSEGKKEFDKLLKGIVLRGGIKRKAKFKSREDLIRFYKNPNNLKKMSLEFRHYFRNIKK